MSKPFFELEKDLGQIRIKMEVKGAEEVKQTAVAVSSAVIQATPFDKGRAKGNWQASHKRPITSFHNSPSLFGESASINRLKSVVKKYKRGGIYVTNNLPYIDRLNNGWSKQQKSPGWIERTAASAFRKLQSKWGK